MPAAGRLVAMGCALLSAAGLAYCNVYDSSLLVPADAGSGVEAGSGIGWWSGNGSTDNCFSAGVPKVGDRPSGGSAADVGPIYLAITGMRLGAQDTSFMASSSAWQDIGFDLDGVCTQSPTCITDSPVVSCKPTGITVPVDGNDCRDNTFGELEVKASSIGAVGGTYGLNDDAFNCALCAGDYNFIIRITGYNGQSDDSQVRVDLYPSTGLEQPLPLDCSKSNWRDAHLCISPATPLTVRDTAVVTPQGGPSLPDAVIHDAVAYVKGGYIVAQLPANTLFWFPGYKAIATAFPLSFAQALVAGRLAKAQDGTWAIEDGTIAGRATEQDIITGFRLIGFCEADTNYALMKTYLHSNLDILASGKVDPTVTCDSISVGIGFTAGQATAGKLVHIADPVECTPRGAGLDGGVEGGSEAGPDAGDAGGQ